MSNPENNYDPAGDTQMFRAFVEEPQQLQQQQAQTGSGKRVGLIIGIVVAVLVIAGVVALAMR
ncbi:MULTISPECIES: hypothetical protein [unclassified Streptomyces]|uniref:hypothetical protein n=1 Tax=unclassified Streptomyces TaxID=2593676 RepID=UPI0022AE850B|nr:MULTISPECIES: hypothetical protein [unclassified Streptomyces]MCZ4123508.1 hypothetical protein [Streptomyces sp. H39-S7]MDF9814263.1 hypothetical protein [Streptomyces sp. SPB162]